MVKALHSGENVHIITYDHTEKQRIVKVMEQAEIDISRVDFVMAKSDDVWARDTGPMFVRDENGKLAIADFTFDGWGKKAPCEKDDTIPQAVSTPKNFPLIEIPGMVRFYDENTLLTVSENDFFELYEGIVESDYEALLSTKNAKGVPYALLELPMTAQNVRGLPYKGSYLNYYIGNEVVLVPVYKDANDERALERMAELYEDRKIVPLDVTALYQYGGMLHCITQQQPKE